MRADVSRDLADALEAAVECVAPQESAKRGYLLKLARLREELCDHDGKLRVLRHVEALAGDPDRLPEMKNIIALFAADLTLAPVVDAIVARWPREDVASEKFSVEEQRIAALNRQIASARKDGDDGRLVDLAGKLTTIVPNPVYAPVVQRLCSAVRADRPLSLAVNSKLARAGAATPEPYANWTKELIATADGSAGFAERMAALRDLAEALDVAIRNVSMQESGRRAYHLRLLRTVCELGDETECDRVLHMVEQLAEDERNDAILRSILWHAMSQPTLRGQIQGLICRLYDLYPERDDIALCYFRIAAVPPLILPVDISKIAALYARMPDDLSVARLYGWYLFNAGSWAAAYDVLKKLAVSDPSATFNYNAGICALKLGRDDEAATIFASISQALSDVEYGELKACLSPICAAVDRHWFLDQKIDHRGLEASLNAAEAALRENLQNVNISPARIFAIADTFRAAEYPLLRNLATHRSRIGFQFEDAYGACDVDAYRVVWISLCSHIIILLERVLSPQSIEQSGGSVLDIVRCAGLYVSIKSLRDETADAREKLRYLESTVGGPIVRRIVETCLLGEPLDAAGSDASPFDSAPGQILCRSLLFAAWCETSGLRPERVFHEPSYTARFGAYRNASEIVAFDYRFPGKDLMRAQARDLRLCDSDLLLARDRFLLRPPAWHLHPDVYPRASSRVVNVGLRGAVLTPPSSVRTVDDPVYVLANNDSVRVPNYFHWTILILTRVAMLCDADPSFARKLLMPREIRPWMKETLSLAGVPDDRIEYSGIEEDVVLRDATVIMSLEYAGRKMLHALRERMWKGSGVVLDPRPARERPAYFLVRKDFSRRPFFGEQAILDQAESAGFTCLSPEEFSVAEQVRLFANAGAIAGEEGAAFANLLYCRADIRVAQIVKQEVQVSVFPDIALALGQEFRWVYARTHPSCLHLRNIMETPAYVDPNTLRAGLAWALHGKSTM